MTDAVVTYSLDGKKVRVLETIKYGAWLTQAVLETGTLAVARAARNLPESDGEQYWLDPVGEWPEALQRWRDSVGVLVTAAEVVEVAM